MAYSARRDGFRDTATISCGMHTISPCPTVDRISFEGQRSREYSRRMVEIRNVRLTDIFLFFFFFPAKQRKRGEERRGERKDSVSLVPRLFVPKRNERDGKGTESERPPSVPVDPDVGCGLQEGGDEGN